MICGNMMKCGLITVGLLGLVNGAKFKKDENGNIKYYEGLVGPDLTLPQCTTFDAGDIVKRSKAFASKNDLLRLNRYRVHSKGNSDKYYFQRLDEDGQISGKPKCFRFHQFEIVKDVNGAYPEQKTQAKKSRRTAVSRPQRPRSPVSGSARRFSAPVRLIEREMGKRSGSMTPIFELGSKAEQKTQQTAKVVVKSVENVDAKETVIYKPKDGEPKLCFVARNFQHDADAAYRRVTLHDWNYSSARFGIPKWEVDRSTLTSAKLNTKYITPIPKVLQKKSSNQEKDIERIAEIQRLLGVEVGKYHAERRAKQQAKSDM